MSRSDAARHRGPCPVQETLGVLGGKWSALVIGRLERGETRFGRLRTQVAAADGAGVSSKALSETLRRLIDVGIVERHARGPAVTYRLTPRGQALVPLLDAVAEWATGPAEAAPSP